MPRGLLPVGRPDRDIQNWRYAMQRRFKGKVTPEDVDEIIETGIRKAKAGDVQWASLVFPYIFGKLPKDQDDASSDVTVNGNVNVVMQELSIEQLEALAALNRIRSRYQALDQYPGALPSSAPGAGE